MTENIDAHIAELMESNQRLRNGYADAAEGLEYVRISHGKLHGVGFDRVADHFFQWVTMPEREGLLAGSHKIPSARITGDKGRENPAEGAPYGEGLIGRIIELDTECRRLCTALQEIADLAYVDHQSGNQNFEYLQEMARGAIAMRKEG